MVAGKTLPGLQIMAAVFKDRSIHKYYQCVVKGVIKEKQLITGFITKDEKTNQVKNLERGTAGQCADHDRVRAVSYGVPGWILLYPVKGDTDHRTDPSDPCPFSFDWTPDRW